MTLMLMPFVGFVALASAPPTSEVDESLVALVDEAVGARPELEQARAEIRAAQERVPQARSWPDPMLQVSVQNDGFGRWQVGKAETSWVLVMASQTIPFPGKPGLRGEIANVEVVARSLAFERTRLTTVADVRRAYLGLQLARERLELLGRLASLLTQAVEIARSRYETGDGPQSDVLRARLELSRLEQSRLVVQAAEESQLEAMNRLRSRPLGTPVAVRPLRELGFPALPDEREAARHSLEVSPECLAARSAVRGAALQYELSPLQYLPDVSVGAGVMARGNLEPMWSLSLGVPLPVFAGTKQARAAAEARASLASASRGVEALEQVLRLRVAQRFTAWRALLGVWRASRDHLLTDSEAAARATLAQYRVGQVPFSSVLEATSTDVSLVEASYGVLVEAWLLAIAQDELSLADVSAASGSTETAAAFAKAASPPGGM